jgi:hypothetical protein
LLGFFGFGVGQRRPALIKQYAHLRRRQSAPGRMFEYGLDVL